jgi:ribonucleoside-diphosphate reductase alpha chain
MSALGKRDYNGDFDENGQLVETPYRPSLAERKAARATPLLTAFGKPRRWPDRYLMPGESFQDMFARVACAYADDADHAQRLYDYMSQLWFMPATPVLSNGGTERGLPISCFLNDVLRQPGRHRRHLERECLAGLQWRRHRHLLGQGPLHRREGEDRPDQRHHPLHPCDGLADPGHQPGLAAARLGGGLSRHHHPEIEEFLEIRKASGDFNRKGLNLHHGINITDEFMRRCGRQDVRAALPRTGEVVREIDARAAVAAHPGRGCRPASPILIFDAVNRRCPSTSASWA